MKRAVPREFVGCSVPVLSVSFLKPVLQNPGFPRVFRIFSQLLWLSCTSMLAHAASSSALAWYMVSRPVSRLIALVFTGKTGGFVAEVVGFELVGDVFKRWDGED